MTQSCDFPTGGDPCPNEAPLKVEMTVAEIVYRADVCETHRGDMVDLLREAFNFRPIAAWVDGKRRDAHIAASGEVFTTADVRAWAIEKGLRTGSAQGRVSIEHIELYAAEH